MTPHEKTVLALIAGFDQTSANHEHLKVQVANLIDTVSMDPVLRIELLAACHVLEVALAAMENEILQNRL